MVRLSCCLIFSATFFLSLTHCNAQEVLLNPHSNSSKYVISNLRIEGEDLGSQMTIAFDYKRIKKGTGYPKIEGRTYQGRIEVPVRGRDFEKDSGTIRFGTSRRILSSSIKEYEIWICEDASWASEGGLLMISNAISIGELKGKTTSRPWTDEEKAKYAEHVIVTTPPVNLPPGSIAIESVSLLVPGMIIQGGWRGAWEDVEVLSVNPTYDRVLVGYVNQESEPVVKKREKWFAANPSVLAAAIEHPEQFTPSIPILEGSEIPVPDELAVLPRGLRLSIGTPVEIETLRKHYSGVVIEQLIGDGCLVAIPWNSSANIKIRSRAGIAMKKTVLANLANPDLNGVDTKYAAEMKEKGLDFYKDNFKLKDYPIRGTAPNDFTPVKKSTPVELGTEILIFKFNRWYPAKTVGGFLGGPLEIKWDDPNEFWNEYIERKYAIIKKTTVNDLNKKRTHKLRTQYRTWTDSTGTHKTMAKYVSKSDQGVQLLRADGKEVVLPLTALSAEDQRLVQSL